MHPRDNANESRDFFSEALRSTRALFPSLFAAPVVAPIEAPRSPNSPDEDALIQAIKNNDERLFDNALNKIANTHCVRSLYRAVIVSDHPHAPGGFAFTDILAVALQSRNTYYIEKLLERPECNVNSGNENTRTALHLLLLGDIRYAGYAAREMAGGYLLKHDDDVLNMMGLIMSHPTFDINVEANAQCLLKSINSIIGLPTHQQSLFQYQVCKLVVDTCLPDIRMSEKTEKLLESLPVEAGDSRIKLMLDAAQLARNNTRSSLLTNLRHDTTSLFSRLSRDVVDHYLVPMVCSEDEAHPRPKSGCG